MNKKNSVEMITAKSKEIAEELGLEIFDVKILDTKRKSHIEIIIDKIEDYVGIEDCSAFSMKIEPWLDGQNIFDKSYDLIVSSPGIDRPIRSLNEFIRFKEKFAKILLNDPINGKQKIKGYIKNVSENTVIFEISEKNKKSTLTIDYSNIKKANLDIDL
ncbi:MAG: ribosome maturation factor [Thermotogae bacterium]|nr:ribosome maturation factor [Thermotogota bacterium]